ncbi:MAG: redoxin domain-containing protein [Prevotella sp.]|nr:redoxin domain-containing protein [Prevotella sp.]
MKKIIATLLLALVATTGWAQKKVWDNVVTGHANVPYFKVTKVAIYDDRTEVFLRLEVPQQTTGESVPLATKPTLTADGKTYAVKGATVISLTEPYTIPAGGKVDFSLIFEPIPENTYLISVAEPNAWSIANVHDADSQPTGIANTYWRNEATGDWLIGFAKQHVIYNNKVYDIVSQTVKKDAYTLTLYDGTTIRVGKMKNGLRQIAIGKNKAIVCSPITGAALPDYPTKDIRTGFVDNGYRADDSVTIIGWLKDMPEEAWKRNGREFEVSIKNILNDENTDAFAPMDSLGRFTLKMPLLNTSQAFLDWGRTTKSTVLEPGKTYFFLNDFMTGQMLWMGDDVRVQNELLTHPHSWESADRDRSGQSIVPMTYLAQADSVRKAQISELEQWVASHPNLSQRYQDYVTGYYQNILGESMMQACYQFPNYEIPQEYLDYAGKECWQKAIKPYTLYRDFATFMRDYLQWTNQKRVWRVNWNVYDYNSEIASNDKELAILNQWKDWIIDANAKVMAAPEEERQKVAEKLNADNADMIKEVDKILQSSKARKVLSGKELMIRIGQEAFVLDSLGTDKNLKDIYLTQMFYKEIDHTHTSLSPMVIDTLKALVVNPVGIAMIEKQNDYYLAIENREFDKLVLKSSDNLANISEGEALLKKILEPYKGKFVLLDIWGTWCGPCKEALSHSTEEYARLKDYDIQYLYLANESPQTSWENVIKEYNVSGPNVAHYNLPREQQAAIERHLGVHAWPTYKLFNRDGELLDLKVSAFDLEGLAGLLEQMK